MPVSKQQHERMLARLGEHLATEATPDSPGEPVRERCAFCGFEASGPLEEARAAFAEHACDRPRPGPRRRFSLD